MVQIRKHFRLILIHHPVRSIKGSCAIFILMSRPPLLARRGDGPVCQYVFDTETLTRLTPNSLDGNRKGQRLLLKLFHCKTQIPVVN